MFKVIAAIRANDAKNVIICGTPTWSQDVDVASQNPITGYSNIMYTFHYYAATHKDSYRSKVTTAVNNGKHSRIKSKKSNTKRFLIRKFKE